jgi:hypothetical protein
VAWRAWCKRPLAQTSNYYTTTAQLGFLFIPEPFAFLFILCKLGGRNDTRGIVVQPRRLKRLHYMMAESLMQSVYDTVPLPLGDSTFIRLISIRASGVSDASSRIVCEFHLLDLENGSLYDFNTISLQSQQMQYKALSYTWGDAASLEIIELGGKPFTVRRNLWTFLDRARKDRFEGYLWIDALCIDQSTISERNH